jgi:hypothetical protein
MQTSMGRTMFASEPVLHPCSLPGPSHSCHVPCLFAFLCPLWFRWAGPGGLVNAAFYVSSALSGV